MSGKQLLAQGKGGINGPDHVEMNGYTLRFDDVGIQLFAGAVAACASKRLYTLLPPLKRIEIIVKAYGLDDGENRQIKELRVEVTYDSYVPLPPQLVEESLWKCPVITFLRDKISSVKITPHTTG